jgi:transcriptional regulator with XRE-family HTH domain
MATTQISKRVNAWRTGQGLTLTQAALAVGVAVATLFQWEAGTSLPSPMAIPALAGVLGMTQADLAALVARERAARLVGAARKRVVVGRVGHGRSHHDRRPVDVRKVGRS